jgi:hypothetical protein
MKYAQTKPFILDFLHQSLKAGFTSTYPDNLALWSLFHFLTPSIGQYKEAREILPYWETLLPTDSSKSLAALFKDFYN